ncbi:MAG: SufS family cysteine desulfurase [Dongiaceae bacterium]
MSFDVPSLRAQFPILSENPGGRPIHYLDNAATAQTPQSVIDAVSRHEATSRGNIFRGIHRLAEMATEAYQDARGDVARYLGVTDPDEIVFTGGTTAGINLLAHAYGATLNHGDEILLSDLEHHSNIVPWQMLRERSGIVLRWLPVTDEGRFDLDALARHVGPRTRMIALTHVSNVTGAETDVGRVVEAARSVGAKVMLDGAQRAPHGPLDLPALGVDFYLFSAHKAYGPNGIGALWGRREWLEALPPFLGGGHMIHRVARERSSYADIPHRFEAGTMPIAQAVGMAAALRWAMALDWTAAAAHTQRLTERLLRGIGGIDGARIVGPAGLQRRTGVVSFDLPGLHPHDICQILDGHGVALRGGHHCCQILMDRFDLTGTTRASIAPYNDDADIDACLVGLEDAVRRLR